MTEPWKTGAFGIWLILAVPLALILSEGDLHGEDGVPGFDPKGIVAALLWPLVPPAVLAILALVAVCWPFSVATEIWRKPWSGEK